MPDDPNLNPSPRLSDTSRVDVALRAIGHEVDEALAAGAARCGPYTLISVLGEGGYGIVYAAVQDEPVSRRVAVKILKRGLDSVEVLRRFALEEHALGRIDHPAVATILDAGVTSDGRPWFAMPLLEGGPITQVCDDCEASIEERLQLFAHACDGVHAAHVQGILHRDLKPANILVVEGRLAGQGPQSVRVIDFGIAKALGDHPAQTLVSDRPRLGTPEYMAPEQSSAWGDADVRTDIYALGLVLGELLSGIRSPSAASSPAAGVLGFERRLISRALTAASVLGTTDGQALAKRRQLVGIATLIRRLRGDLDAIVAKATMHEPSLRYQSADAFATDVRRTIADLPISARAPGFGYVVHRAFLRHKITVSLSAAALVAIIALALVAVAKSVEAERGLARASVEARRQSDVSETLGGVFDGIKLAIARGEDPKILANLLEEASRRLVAQLPKRDAVTSAQVAVTMARALTDIERPTEAIALLTTVAERLRSELGARDRIGIAPTDEDNDVRFELARVLGMLGDSSYARHHFRSAAWAPLATPPEAFAAWRSALDLLINGGLDARDPRLATSIAVSLWRSREPWRSDQTIQEFDLWITPRVMALDDSDELKWQFLFRRAEFTELSGILREYPILLVRATAALSADHPVAVVGQCRLVFLRMAAGVESRSDPKEGTPTFTDDELDAFWVETATMGEQSAAAAERVYGARHSETIRAKMWWLLADGYAFGPEKRARKGLALLREEASSLGEEGIGLVNRIDQAVRMIDLDESQGGFWK